MANNRIKVALVTASHLSSCPRLLKEAELLSSRGYDIHIVYLHSVPKIEKLDNEIVINNKSWNFYPIYWYGEKSKFFKKWISKLKFKFFHILNIKSDYIQSTSDVLIKKVLTVKADLYITHHPSVLVAVSKAASKYKSKYIYDVEDAFSYMDTLDINKPDPFVFHVENKYIHNSSLLTFASPLYRELYLKTFNIDNRMLDVLNLFKWNEVKQIKYLDRIDLSKISFYWHSQTVGLNRGLQEIIKALSNFNNNKWELHIRGHYTEEVKNALLYNTNDRHAVANIFFHQAVSSSELPLRTIEHDIGLALESSVSINRDLCISNKILEYLASGLLTIATNTKGHLFVMEKINAKDFTFSNADELMSILNVIFSPSFDLDKYINEKAHFVSEELNWDLQSQNWLNEIEDLLK